MFNKKILNKYLTNLDEIEVSEAFSNLSDFKSSIKNIKEAKEEQYQAGFLNDFFVKALGYTIFPKENYDLTTELKNETDSKKADGAILKDNKVIAIIELKSIKTKSMENIVNQAFNYKNNHPTCKYIITSNFAKIRLYIEYSNEFIEFDLFNLSFENFKVLYLLLYKKNLFDDIALKIKNETKINQENIAKEFYKKYSNIRIKLLENIINKNSEIDKNLALNLTQKLLDRFIFIFFAEDKIIIDNKTTEKLINLYKNDIDYRDLYYFIKALFKAIDVGNERLGISSYNGGLFKDDEFLNNLSIDDKVLMEVLTLANYDFDSEIDVNILGHIFENSLDDLEKIRENGFKEANRKKDGIFYTPNYITEYIVKNTLGTICEAKKSELNLNSDTQNIEALNEYKEFLKNLKIIDPACGSGAFLNQAFNYLLVEYKFVYGLLNQIAQQKQDLLVYEEVDLIILENNLFGVDINHEAVEIAKLSLWLKTAKKGRKLTNLNNNFKCANSLLNMPFEFNSFDVVVGNPPYGAKINSESEKYEIKSNESAILFMQLAYKLLKSNGLHGFIIPKSFIFASTWKTIRDKFLNEINILVDCFKVWNEVKLEQVIYTLQKNENYESYENLILKNETYLKVAEIDKKLFDEFGFFINNVDENEIDLGLKIKNDKLNLFEISKCSWGDTFFKEIQEKGEIQILAGANIQQYEIKDIKGFITENIKVSKNAFIRKNSILLQRLIAHIQNPIDHIKITGTISDNLENFYIVNTVQQITLKDEFSNRFILAIMHSKLMNWYVYRFLFAKAIRTFQFSNDVIQKVPIPQISEKAQEPFIKLVDEIINSKEKIKKYKKHFDKLSATDKIEISEEIEKLEKRVIECENEIDKMVYKLYDLSEEEIKIVEDTK